MVGASRNGQLSGSVAVEVPTAAQRTVQTAGRGVEPPAVFPEGNPRDRRFSTGRVLDREPQRTGGPAVIHRVEPYRGLLAVGHVADDQCGGAGSVVGVD